MNQKPRTWNDILLDPLTKGMTFEEVMYEGKLTMMLVVKVNNGLGSKDFYKQIVHLPDQVPYYYWAYRN
jgi:hypothetical protein